MEVLAAVANHVGFALAIGGAVVRTAFCDVAPAACRRGVAWTMLTGALLVGAGGMAEVWAVVDWITFGRVDANAFVGYLRETRHGMTVALRFVGAVFAALVATRFPCPPRRTSAPLTVAGVAWLATAAVVGHTGSMGVPYAVVSLAHLAAMATWIGSLATLAGTMNWSDAGAIQAAFRRLGRIGVVAVAVLGATGFAMARLHLQGPDSWASSYGAALSVKLVLVAGAVALAAVNRRWLLPSVRSRGGRRLAVGVWTEGVLLSSVLVATAVVGSQPPVHGS